MINIGICDDKQNICTLIEEMILKYMRQKGIVADINVWYSGEVLCSNLKQGNQIDILFLDIELFEVSGIEVGEFIRKQLQNRGMQIIYISAEPSYAQKLFKTQPMDFLIKPITQQQINEALELAIKIIRQNRDKFEFQNGRDYYFIPFGEIMYFLSEGRKIKIVMHDDEKEFYGKLKDLNLPDEFIVIHQSYVVNKEYIIRYTYEMVELINGTILTISKVNRKRVREKILQED